MSAIIIKVKLLPCVESHGNRERCDQLSLDKRMSTRLHDQRIYSHPRMDCLHRSHSIELKKGTQLIDSRDMMHVIVLPLYGIVCLDIP